MAMKSFLAGFLGVSTMFFMALTPARAEDPLAFPLGCRAGSTCWIMGYPDLNRAPDIAQDYMCGPGADEGDVFMHIALPDLGVMKLGMSVIAIDDGKVVDASDQLDDTIASSRAQVKTGTPNCGNGIVIEHAGGMESVYCHLKKGSARVATGDRVSKGQIIASAGQSGVAFWPQLGFSMRKSGFFIDPVTGASPIEGCGSKPHPAVAIPDEFLKYQPAAIVALGFSNTPVTEAQLVRGDAPRFAGLDSGERSMNLWAMILGVKQNDKIEIRLRDPRGRTFYYSDITADKDMTRMPLNITRTRGYANWRTGLYTGEITLTRKIGVIPYSVTRDVTMEVD